LALRPDPLTRIALEEHAAQLCTNLGLRGARLSADHFHVSLHCLAYDIDLRHDLIKAMHEVAAKFTASAFAVTFDRVMRFESSNAVVLTESSENFPLHQFHRELGLILLRAGLGRYVVEKFKPHLTLLYDTQPVPEQTIAPVRWTVDEFVLIDSLVGQTRHIKRGHWPLRG
jgi:2'-5' RNA ligase